MRPTLLFFAASAAALVTRDEVKRKQLSLLGNQDKPAPTNAVQAWWDALPNPGNLLSSVEQRITKSTRRRTDPDNFLALVDPYDEDQEDHHPHPPHGGHGHRGHQDKTIYELIKDSQHATKFAKLIEEYDEIKQLLDDTEHNYTLFVPTDQALDHIHHGHHGKNGDDDDDDDHHRHDHKRPSKEFILSFIKYHIVPGLYSAHRIHTSRTLPTELHPSALGTSSAHHKHQHPQRIRAFTVPFIHLTRLNFHTRPIGPEIHAKNGLLRAVDTPLIPPLSQTALVRLLPGQFSTLALALETTGLGEELEGGQPRSGGGTLFAPTNHAWAALGPRANAFLFSPPGRPYLRALLRYHVVINETLYSDAYYRDGSGGEKEEAVEEDEVVGDGNSGYWHVDLPSLLEGKPISVDVKTWKGLASIVVNGFVKVTVRDVVADDGVVQVVGRVLIPPHKHRGGDRLSGGQKVEDDKIEEVSPEELKARLEPYLEESEKTSGRDIMGDL